jgi:2-C-methyl-D-erythritol 2,4-cyclodiphosphate synthase
MMKIGIGYDIHRLVDEKKLFLGGIEIPYIKGLISHTDGDVVLHAIADALLGAMALGDIGRYFPDSNPDYKNVPSGDILQRVARLVDENKYAVNNVDAVVIAEEPKIYPFKDRMTENIANILGVDKSKVNVKATTNEGVGSLGRGEAIAAYAVVTLAEKIK